MEECLAYEPMFFNAHSGSDAWSVAEAEDFYAQAIDLEKKIGVPVSHETHRQRYFATPWQTRHILQQFPDLRITCDLSHWVCVCERLLPDLGETISLAAQHCHHIHARVGFAEGPQVPDPSAPEYATDLAAHEAWWEQIWQSQKRARIHPLHADSRVWPAAVFAHPCPIPTFPWRTWPPCAIGWRNASANASPAVNKGSATA